MYDPLTSPNPFASSVGAAPPWQAASTSEPEPSTPTTPAPQTPAKSPGLYGKEPQIYGAPEPGLVSPSVTTSANGTRLERTDPYLRVRITALDRNRRDILIRFDAQASVPDGSTGHTDAHG